MLEFYYYSIIQGFNFSKQFISDLGMLVSTEIFPRTSRLYTTFIHTPRTLLPPFFKKVSNGLFKTLISPTLTEITKKYILLFRTDISKCQR